MGFRICYLASRLPPREFAGALNVELSDKGQDDFSDGTDWWVGCVKTSGWSLLWSEDEEFGARSRDLFVDASRNADLIHCEVNETCMWCSSEYWSQGHPLWKVTHAGDGGDIFDLSTEGTVPDPFHEIKEKYFRDQRQETEDCDHIFEIPLELAKSFINFRHDEVFGPDECSEFHIIVAPPKQSFFFRILRSKRPN